MFMTGLATTWFNMHVHIIIWAAKWQNQQNECAPSNDSDQPGHPPSLIRVITVRMKKAWVLSYPLSAQQRLWSDWANALADLSLCWAHSQFCWFCHVVAHIYMNFTHFVTTQDNFKQMSVLGISRKWIIKMFKLSLHMTYTWICLNMWLSPSLDNG